MRNTITLIKDSITSYKMNFRLVAGVMLPLIIASLLVTLFEPSPYTGVVTNTEGAIILVLYVLYFIISLFTGVALIKVVAARALTIHSAYSSTSIKLVFKYLAVSVLVGLFVMLGFVALVIPGIFLAVSLSFATYTLILEDLSIMASIKKSFSLVKGRWFAVFGKLVFAVIIALVASFGIGLIVGVPLSFVSEIVSALLVDVIIMLLMTPISAFFLFNLYSDLKKGIVSTEQTTMPSTPSYTGESTIGSGV